MLLLAPRPRQRAVTLQLPARVLALPRRVRSRPAMPRAWLTLRPLAGGWLQAVLPFRPPFFGPPTSTDSRGKLDFGGRT